MRQIRRALQAAQQQDGLSIVGAVAAGELLLYCVQQPVLVRMPEHLQGKMRSQVAGHRF